MTMSDGGSSPREPSEFEDSGSEYQLSISSESEDSTVASTSGHTETPRKGKKRLRREGNWRKKVRKFDRNSGNEYINVRGNIVPKKTPFDGECQCFHKCNTLISIDQRKRIFEDFYKLANFDLQTAYINGQVNVVSKGRFTNAEDPNKRNKTRIYTLPDESGDMKVVCKSFFKNTLRVSDGRLTRALVNKTKGGEIVTPPIDRRGKHPPGNKTPATDIENVKTFIGRFATYTSHYSRVKNPNRRYMSPDLNISKLYDLYSQSEEPIRKVSKFVFSKIFNEDFNLHFRYPATDTCKKCDSINVKLKTPSINNEEKKQLELEKDLHLRKAESARNGMREDPKKSPETTTTIAFDLMKTLTTPSISTGVAYYKRQLWTYCLGIHNLTTGDAHMYVWHEGVASRGPQEIGSCIMHYVKNNVRTPTLIMYSDQCGGQNRNIKMASICSYMVASDEFIPEVIHHKCLVSGHSYLPCDRDFGMIERQKRFFSDIFLPDDWIKVILSAKKRNKFIIVKMQREDFKSTEKLENLVTNRKKGEEGVKVEWLKIQWLMFKKEEPFNINFKYSNNEDTLFHSVNVTKKRAEVNQIKSGNFQLDELYPTGRPIEKLKYKDLQCLLPFIPPIAHDFYNILKTNEHAYDEDILEESED